MWQINNMATKTWQWVKVTNGTPEDSFQLHDSIENAGINLNDENCEFELVDATKLYDKSVEMELGFYERLGKPKIEKVDGIWTAIPQKVAYEGVDLIQRRNVIRELFLGMVEEEKKTAQNFIDTTTDETQLNGWKQRLEDLENYEHNELDPQIPQLPEDCVPT